MFKIGRIEDNCIYKMPNALIQGIWIIKQLFDDFIL